MTAALRGLTILLGKLDIKCCKRFNADYIPPHKMNPRLRIYGWELQEYIYGFSPTHALSFIDKYLGKHGK